MISESPEICELRVKPTDTSGPVFKFLTSVGDGRSPLDDQGIFISIIVWNQTHHLKFQFRIKGLRSEIASSHLRPYLLKVRSIHGLSEKSGPDAFSSVVGADRHRDNMPVLREDDITQDFLSRATGIATDQKGIGMEHVKLQKGRPIIR